MSSVEIGHRVVQQAKRMADRTSSRGWSGFGGFAGEVSGLPGLRPNADIVGAWREPLAMEAAATLAARFTYLGQSWPMRDPVTEMGWGDDLWKTDPISGALWPGGDRFSFDTPYRHGAASGDVKFVWELNRLQCLPPLALHAWLTEDRAMSASVFHILRDWMRANPPYRGVNWISGVEAASRVASLLAALAFVGPDSDEDAAAVRAFLQAHAHWIARYPSRFSSANNHRIAELTALFMAHAGAHGLADSDRILRWAQADLEAAMLCLFHPDGVGAEQSVFYAAYALEWCALAGVVGDAIGRPFSDAYRERARLAVDHLRWLLDDAGQAPCIGDSDDGRVLALTQGPELGYVASVAAMAARWLQAPEPPTRLRAPTLRDLLGAPSPSSPAPIGVRTFRDGGLTLWRRLRDDGALLLAFDHGPLGHLSIAAHGHADALSVWLHWGEEAVFVDPGTHLYHAAGASRDALRGTSAHNTLCLAGQDQSRIVGPFAWSEHARVRLIHAAQDVVAAEHDGYLRRFGLIHQRRVESKGAVILIEDRLLGCVKVPNIPWSVGFTLAPGVQVDIQGDRVDLYTPKGRRLSLTSEASDGAPPQWTSRRTPYAPAFGTLDFTPRIELSGTVCSQITIQRIRIVLAGASPHQDKPT